MADCFPACLPPAMRRLGPERFPGILQPTVFNKTCIKEMNSRKAELLMASVTLAWGSSYLLMKVGLDGIGPYNLIAMRFGIAFIAMSLMFFPRFRQLTLPTLAKGLVMGVILFLIFYGMVNGVNMTTASTAGFLTSTTVVIVPLLQSLIGKTLPSRNIVIAILISITGLFLLTAKDGVSLDAGAIYCLIGAFFYALYIIVFDKLAKGNDALIISIIQLGVASLIGAAFMLFFEVPSLPETPLQWGAIMGLGLICSAYGFVVQPIAQRYTSAENIGLIFSLEPVFSALLSYIFLHEILALRGYVGAAMIFGAVVFTELSRKPPK